MFAAHLLWIDPFDWGNPSTWTAIAQGRSSILFATLAGVSIGLVTGERTPPPDPELAVARRRLAVRALLLWLLGVVLIGLGVPVAVILPAYAILFLLATRFLNLRPGTLLCTAAAIAVTGPFLQVWLDALPWWSSLEGETVSLLIGWNYPFPLWLAFVLAGLGLARLGVRRLPVQLGMLAAGAVLSAAAYTLDALAERPGEDPSYWEALWTARPHSSGLLEAVGSGGFAIAVLGLCLLISRTSLTWPLLPIRAVGAMPLTAYAGQLVGWAVAATALLGTPSDLAAFRDLQPFWPMLAATVIGCTVWTLLIGRGPVERVVSPALSPAPRSTPLPRRAESRDD